jgi:hypothetical protein
VVNIQRAPGRPLNEISLFTDSQAWLIRIGAILIEIRETPTHLQPMGHLNIEKRRKEKKEKAPTGPAVD